MIYLDTSVLVPLYVNEPGSLAVRELLASLPQKELTLSEWSRTGDCASFLPSRRAEFNSSSRGSRDFALANEYLERFNLGLRAGDALHLAIARNQGAQGLYSLDRVMLRCTPRLGIKAHGVRY